MESAANFFYDHPLGPIYGWFTEGGLRRLSLPPLEKGPRRIPVLHSASNDSRARDLRNALERYFAGLKEDFESIPTDLAGATPFQRDVWQAARGILWGHASAYGALAARIGIPKAARAVGRALAANPIVILVPCHRILRSGGQLGGYSAGLTWKRTLLRLEGAAL